MARCHVRKSGGLADSVVDVSPESGTARTATGFVSKFNSTDLLACIERRLIVIAANFVAQAAGQCDEARFQLGTSRKELHGSVSIARGKPVTEQTEVPPKENKKVRAYADGDNGLQIAACAKLM